MRQRVALIRTLIMDPDILLLDEPFSALDYQTRLYLEGVLKDAVETYHKTVILVTHDIDEAVALSKRVVVLSGRPARVKIVHDIDIARHLADRRAQRQPVLRLFPHAVRRTRHPDRENRVTLTHARHSAAAQAQAARARAARASFDTTLGRAAAAGARRDRASSRCGKSACGRAGSPPSWSARRSASSPPASR